MNEDGDIVISLRLADEDIERQIGDLSGRMARHGEELGASLSRGAKEGGGALSWLSEKMQEYRREETQQARSTRFFAAQLGEMLPASAGQAAGALGVLATTGSVAGLAFEGVKYVLEKVIEQAAETARKATELAEKNQEAAFKSLAAWQAYYETIANAEKTQAQIVSEKNEQELIARQRATGEAIGEIQKRIKANEELAASYDASERGDAQRLYRAKSEHAALLAEQAAAQAEYDKILEELRLNKLRAENEADKKHSADMVAEGRKRMDAILDQMKGFNEKWAEGQKQRKAEQAKLLGDLWGYEKEQQDRVEALRLAGQHADYEAAVKRDQLQQHFADLEAARGNVETARKLDALMAEIAKERQEADDAYSAGVLSKEAYEKEKTRIQREQAKQRGEILRAEAANETTVSGEMSKFVGQAYQHLSGEVVNAIGKMLTQSRAYNEAMHASGKTAIETAEQQRAATWAWVQDQLAAIAKMAAVKALDALANAYFMTARAAAAEGADPGADAAAAAYLSSAAVFGAIAVGSGVGAYAIGQNRGMTAAEAQAAGSGSSLGAGSSGASADRVGTGSAGGGSSGGTFIQREIVYVVDGGFGGEAEAARRFARVQKMANRLGMR